jgi:hypothetical protein
LFREPGFEEQPGSCRPENCRLNLSAEAAMLAGALARLKKSDRPA